MTIVYLILRLQERDDLKAYIMQGENNSFLDFFLRACNEYILDCYKVDVRKMYDQQQKFFKERKPIGAYIKRNLICAAGNLFSHKSYKNYQRKYIYLVKDLISKGETQTAWFLIRNSIEHDNEPLHPELYGFLLKLMKNQFIMARHGKEIKRLYDCQTRLRKLRNGLSSGS